MAVLHLLVRASGLRVAARVEERGGEDLRVVRVDNLLDLVRRRVRLDDLVLALGLLATPLAVLLLDLLVLLQEALEALRRGVGLATSGLVALGELEEALDGVLALLAEGAGLAGDDVGLLDSALVGGVLRVSACLVSPRLRLVRIVRRQTLAGVTHEGLGVGHANSLDLLLHLTEESVDIVQLSPEVATAIGAGGSHTAGRVAVLLAIRQSLVVVVVTSLCVGVGRVASVLPAGLRVRVVGGERRRLLVVLVGRVWVAAGSRVVTVGVSISVTRSVWATSLERATVW